MAAPFGRLLPLLALTACGSLHALPWRHSADQRVPSTRAEVDARIRNLVNLEGDFRFGDAVFGIMTNDNTLEELAAADTVGLRSLVACLSDERRTHVTLHGRRVTVGRLCGHALIGTAYVQTGMRRRAFPEDWRWFPHVSADSLDLRAVQQAWVQWLHEHELVWPLPPGYVPPCPSRESISPERFRDIVSTDGSRRTYQRVQETLADFRYVTYVVDSEFVVMLDRHPRSASDSLRSRVLEDLSADDIANISIRKSEHEAWKWRACEGVPVALIVTKSKRWRPRSLPAQH